MNFQPAYAPLPIEKNSVPNSLLPTYYFYLHPSYSATQPSASYAGNGGESDLLSALTDGVAEPYTTTPLTQFFTRKRAFAAKSVQEIVGLIYQREALKYDTIRAIDYQSCGIGTKLLETPDWRTGLDPRLDRTRGQLEGQLIALEQEKRREQIASWRDITRLKLELNEHLKEFNQEQHKAALLTAPWKSENSAKN